jgi:hypothetical protein
MLQWHVAGVLYGDSCDVQILDDVVAYFDLNKRAMSPQFLGEALDGLNYKSKRFTSRSVTIEKKRYHAAEYDGNNAGYRNDPITVHLNPFYPQRAYCTDFNL